MHHWKVKLAATATFMTYTYCNELHAASLVKEVECVPGAHWEIQSSPDELGCAEKISQQQVIDIIRERCRVGLEPFSEVDGP